MLRPLGGMDATKVSEIRINQSSLFQPDLLPPFAPNNIYCFTAGGSAASTLKKSVVKLHRYTGLSTTLVSSLFQPQPDRLQSSIPTKAEAQLG